jgi:ABC-type lipoprotein release transport system permease subunit
MNCHFGDRLYLGESGILFNLTRLPAPGTVLKMGGSIPGLTWIILGLLVGLGLAILIGSIQSCRNWHKDQAAIVVRAPRLQFACWVGLVWASVFLLVLGHSMFALCSLLCAQLFPRYKVEEPDEWESTPQPVKCRR